MFCFATKDYKPLPWIGDDAYPGTFFYPETSLPCMAAVLQGASKQESPSCFASDGKIGCALPLVTRVLLKSRCVWQGLFPRECVLACCLCSFVLFSASLNEEGIVHKAKLKQDSDSLSSGSPSLFNFPADQESALFYPAQPEQQSQEWRGGVLLHTLSGKGEKVPQLTDTRAQISNRMEMLVRNTCSEQVAKKEAR